MIELDAGPVEGNGSFLRTALVLSAILQKPVHITNIALQRTFQGLSADKIAFIHALATATGASFFGVEPGSTSITFSPTHPWSKKKISLGLQGSVSLALQGLLLPALFSRKKVHFFLTGRTHALHSPTTTYMQQVFFRYLHPLVDELSLKEKSFGFTPSGSVEVVVKGRVNRLSPLQISGTELLAGVRLELIASKKYLSSEVLHHVENLAKLIYPSLLITTRYVTTKEPGIIAALFAFYGDKYGFDNDRSFVVGKDKVWQGDFTREEIEKKVTLFLEEFIEHLDKPAIDEFCADQLIVLLALLGGSVKVRRVSQRVKANIAAAQLLSGTTFTVKNNVIVATPHIDAL